ncbi:MAG: sulfite exporter TauE/SafE family protein [Burkholderiales bacterium]|nr:sulfite exporter TauE/SafE family protein [Burkholderiales bacterium]
MTLALTAFLTGLLSGVHCIAMCGGVVSALSMSARGRAAVRVQGGGAAALGGAASWSARVPVQIAYSGGRILSYAVAGAVAGGIGGTVLLTQSVLPAQMVLAVLANSLLMLLGLHLAGIGGWVAQLERLGAPVWRRLAPLGRRFMPADTAPKAFAVGTLWGWLPCGLVYSTLALALMSGGAGEGAMVMLAFGLGTLPNLVMAGLAIERLQPLLRRTGVRRGAAALVFALGVWGLVRTPGLYEAVREGILCLM